MVDESENSRRRRNYPRTVCTAGLLLVLQAGGYVAFSVYLLLPFGGQTGVLSPLQTDARLLGFALIAASVLSVLSAIGFLMLWRAGWLLAMALQGATLLGCLALYFGMKPAVIFPVMLYCIVMAFYLNSSGVRVAFFGAATHEH